MVVWIGRHGRLLFCSLCFCRASLLFYRHLNKASWQGLQSVVTSNGAKVGGDSRRCECACGLSDRVSPTALCFCEDFPLLSSTKQVVFLQQRCGVVTAAMREMRDARRGTLFPFRSRESHVNVNDKRDGPRQPDQTMISRRSFRQLARFPIYFCMRARQHYFGTPSDTHETKVLVEMFIPPSWSRSTRCERHWHQCPAGLAM